VVLPPFASSAMDGFVVRAEDTVAASVDSPITLRVLGSIAAGDAPSLIGPTMPHQPASCFEIMTGAPLPVEATGTSNANVGAFVPSRHLNACVRVEDVEMVYAAVPAAVSKTELPTSSSGWFVPGLRATHIRIRRPVTTGQHVRRAGEDVSAGTVLLASNAFVKPEHVLALANAGIQRIYVLRKVRIAVLHTGSELRQTYTAVDDDNKANGPPAPGASTGSNGWSASPPRACIPDSNGPFLRAALERSFGAADSVTLMGCLPDQLDATCAGLRRALRGEHKGATNDETSGSLVPHPNHRFDVLLTTGGVSVGRHDLVPAALHAVGCRQLFHGVAVKPGHPLLVAVYEGDKQPEDKTNTQAADSEVVPAASLHSPHSSIARPSPVVCFGLPGNPVAAGVGVRFFVHSWLRTLWRQQEERPMMARLHLVSELDGSAPSVHNKMTMPPMLRPPPPGSITFLKAQLCSRPPGTGLKYDAVDPAARWVQPACASLQQASRCASMMRERFVWIQLSGAPLDAPVSAHSSSSSSSTNGSTGLPPSSAAVLSDGALVAAWPAHAGCMDP
jgi:molybdopterin molybdotransferase